MFFPLDEQLAVWDKKWSEGVARQAVKWSGRLTFEEVVDALGDIGQIEISKSSVWRRVKKWGKAFQTIEEKKREEANRLPERGAAEPGRIKGSSRKGVSMDGTMIHILGEGWKELKVGCIFDVVESPTLDPETLEWETMGHAVNNSYVAHLGGPEPFGQILWSEAKRRDWTKALDSQVVGDGVVWIWNLAIDHFYDSHQTVDWYHGVEHLANAAFCVYGEQETPRKKWLNELKRTLFLGHAEDISLCLKEIAEGENQETQKVLLQEAGYFENNKRRMNYLDMRTDGWVIGSGMVESCAMQFKDRFDGAGMRWSRKGAERLIPIRSAIMGHRFDVLWSEAYNSPNN